MTNMEFLEKLKAVVEKAYNLSHMSKKSTYGIDDNDNVLINGVPTSLKVKDIIDVKYRPSDEFKGWISFFVSDGTAFYHELDDKSGKIIEFAGLKFDYTPFTNLPSEESSENALMSKDEYSEKLKYCLTEDDLIDFLYVSVDPDADVDLGIDANDHVVMFGRPSFVHFNDVEDVLHYQLDGFSGYIEHKIKGGLSLRIHYPGDECGVDDKNIEVILDDKSLGYIEFNIMYDRNYSVSRLIEEGRKGALPISK